MSFIPIPIPLLPDDRATKSLVPYTTSLLSFTGMSTSLADLPFDIVHQIASQLDIRSFDSLGKSCKALSRHLRNDTTAKNALQVHGVEL